MTVAMKINEELNGIELYFASKPDQNVLTNLKSNGFRWSGYNKCWYTKQSEKAFQVANNLVTGVIEEVSTITKKSSKNIISLWESTQFKMEINSKNMECKEIAKEIRSHIKKQFPQCKFSVTVPPYYGKINFSIKSSPFEKGSIYLNAIKEYCSILLNAYNYCYSLSDPHTDYAGSYNFYGRVEIAWEYTQSETTEQIKSEMSDFDIKFIEAEKAEQQRKEEEYQAYVKEQELKNAEYAKRQEEEKKQINHIYNSINVMELEETNQYFVIGSEFAHLNKNNTLDQYKEEVSTGKFSLENVKITKEIHFNNKESLNSFSNLLLHDFDFLINTGGSFTDNSRINSMVDFDNMGEYERQFIKWNLYGVAIYFNNQLQFVVDAQGYSYARYVGLTDNSKIEKDIEIKETISNEELTELKLHADVIEDMSSSIIDELNITGTWENESWNQYKESMKTKLITCNFKLTKEIIQQLEIEELKVAMYKLLVEVDGIQDQFTNANIQLGEKITLFYISDFGSIVTSRITFDNVVNTKYAQYDNAVKLNFTPENKRKLHYKHFHSTLLVYKGWHSLPENVLNNVTESNGMRITRSKYGSCDKKQYDEILNYFEGEGIKPIVNTYKYLF